MTRFNSLTLILLFISSQFSSINSLEQYITKKEQKAAIGFALGMVAVYGLAKKYPQILDVLKHSSAIIFIIACGKTAYDVIKWKRNRPQNADKQTIAAYDHNADLTVFIPNSIRISLSTIFVLLVEYLRANHYDNFTIKNALLTMLMRAQRNMSFDDFDKFGRYATLIPLFIVINKLINKNNSNNTDYETKFTFESIKPNVKFTDVAGAHEAKRALKTIVDMLDNPNSNNILQAKLPKGVLLVGDPGCGKTLLAKALAGEANCSFFSVSGSEFQLKWLGDGQTKIRNLFAQARKSSPAIIFFDEFDAIAINREHDTHNHYSVTLNQLLVEMDGMESNNKIVVLAATNLPHKLDPGAIRPGRFDRKIKIENPKTPEERLEVLKIHTAKLPLAADVDLRTIANHIGPLKAAADIATLVNQAKINTQEDNKNTVEYKHFHDAILMLLNSKNAITI